MTSNTVAHRAPLRDYSLNGPCAQYALDTGFAAAEWYHSDVPRKTIKALMKRRDGPAIRDNTLWISVHILCTLGGIYFWDSWGAWPFWFAYGVVYGSA